MNTSEAIIPDLAGLHDDMTSSRETYKIAQSYASPFCV